MKTSPRSSLFTTFLPATLACVLLTSAECFADSTNCVLAPAGIVSWWRAEGNAQDATGANSGALAGNTTIGTGRVGQAFVFDGNNDAANLGNPTNLQLQNFTLEAWVKRASATVTSQSSPTFGNLFAHGWGGYALGFEHNGRLYLGRVGLSSVGIDSAVTDTNWHHVAVTKQGSSVVFYVDGSAYPAPAYDTVFTFASSFAIGAQGDDLAASFYGAIDELSVYDRALTATELQAIFQADTNGKCAGPPVIRKQPANQTVAVGGSTSFTVMAVGSPQLTYQWRFNETNLLSVNDAILTLPNVQSGNAGNYSVVITNLYGAATSSVAALTLAAPPCAAPASGMVSWWRAEGDVLDIQDGNAGVLIGNTTYGPGRVGQAFVFDGNGDAAILGNPINLQLQDFTIETWIKRATTAYVSSGPGVDALFLGYGPGGYGFGLDRVSGRPLLSRIAVDALTADVNISDTNWHHLAMTKSGATVVFYVDGVPYSTPPYYSVFTFNTSVAIGATGEGFGNSFFGSIDELAVYSRALSTAEIQTIYNAGEAGKCTAPAAPTIAVQPTNQTAVVGANATFSVRATGTIPLTYQWRFNETNLVGLNDAALTLPDIQFSHAGSYSVVITNLYGAATSAVAVLTVVPTPACVTPPAGLVSWWRAEGNGLDAGSGNPGVLIGNAGYGSGKVGQSFVFDGNSDAVVLGSPPNLQLQDFTIETWIKRATTAYVSSGPGVDALFLGYGPGGYGFGLDRVSGRPLLSRITVDSLTANVSISDTNWHHLAMTKSGTTVVFYVDGVPYATPPYSSVFTFTTSVAVGATGEGYGNSFFGSIDDLSVYNRALALNEIQSIYNSSSVGKCVVPIPPTIVAHPQSISVLVGASTTLTVVAAGFAPLNYQWRFNGTDLAGATNSSLTLNNVQSSHVGNYSVQVTNGAGSVSSSNSALTVTVPTPVIRAVGTNAMAGAPVTVPLTISANGNENTLGLSLNFSTQRLAYASVTWGDSVAGAALLLNTNQTGLGRLGLAVSFPSGTAFPAGTQEVIRVHFNSLPWTGTMNTTLSFGDLPVLREMYNTQLQPLPANYQSGIVTLTPTVFEGDVFPRPNGNQVLTLADWAQAARFAARLDIPASSSEFQRADSAPRATLGDGRIKVTDWAQTGRYIAGLDPAAAIGGPTVEIAPNGSSVPGSRQLRVGSTNLLQGQSATITVELQAQGDENALGFTLSFDPAALTFNNVNLGSNMGGASLTANTTQSATGRLGLVLGLSTGNSFGVGSRELVEVTFTASSNVTGDFPITLTDQLVTRCVSDTLAGELPAEYIGGMIAINSLHPAPTLAIGQSGTNIVLSWPLWAWEFSLQTLALNDSWTDGWTNAPAQWQTNGAVISLTLPIAPEARFFRLFHP
jgi:hypothetical protein